jgi:hypothetical protein
MREMQKPYLTHKLPQKTPQTIDYGEFVTYEEVKKSDSRLLVNTGSAAASAVVELLGATAVVSGVFVLKVVELSLRGVVYLVLVLVERMSRMPRDYDRMPDNPCRPDRRQSEGQRGGQNMQFNNCHNITINNY